MSTPAFTMKKHFPKIRLRLPVSQDDIFAVTMVKDQAETKALIATMEATHERFRQNSETISALLNKHFPVAKSTRGWESRQHYLNEGHYVRCVLDATQDVVKAGDVFTADLLGFLELDPKTDFNKNGEQLDFEITNVADFIEYLSNFKKVTLKPLS